MFYVILCTYIINEIQIPILKSEEKLFCDVFSLMKRVKIFTIHLFGSKPKYHTYFSIEFGKIRLCRYGLHISKFTK